MDRQVSIEMGIFVVGIRAKSALEIFLAGVSFLMAFEVWFLVELFLAGFALELRWTVVNLVILEATFSAENLLIEGFEKMPSRNALSILTFPQVSHGCDCI
jgi:hypothetical protein